MKNKNIAILIVIVVVASVVIFGALQKKQTIKKDELDVSNLNKVGNIKDQYGRVKDVKTAPNGWLVTVDYIYRNPNWIPGGSESFFLSTNVRTSELSIKNDETKFFKCGGNKDISYGPVVPSKVEEFISQIKKELLEREPSYVFDVTDNTIDVIYTQCLP